MRLMGASEDPADSVGQLIGGEQPIGLVDDLAIGVDPHRLNRVQPPGLLGKKADDDAYPRAASSDLARLWAAIQFLTDLLLCQLALSQIRSRAFLPISSSLRQLH